MKRRKDLNYYIGLDYDVKVVRVEDEDEVAYKAYAAELDPNAFYGVGSTKSEALESFEETRKQLIPIFLEDGIPIPEPEREPDDMPSGRFVVRTSPSTHRKLVRLSKKHNQSLNSFINAILEQYTTLDAVIAKATAVFEQTCSTKMMLVNDAWISSQVRPEPKKHSLVGAKAYEKAA